MERFIYIGILLTLAVATGEDITVSGGGVRLVRITGLKSIPPTEIRQLIGTQIKYIESSGVSMARADDAAYFLETSLRQRGFRKATVDWKLVDGDSGRKQILLIVDEGQGSMIGAIQVTGNEAIEDPAVVELLTSGTRKRINAGPEGNLPYVSDDLRKGVTRIREFYHLLGFLDVDVKLTPGRSNLVDLDVTIIEGVQYKVGVISLPEAPCSKVAAGFERIEEELSGKNYFSDIPTNLSSRIESVARDCGYYDVEVSVEVRNHNPERVDRDSVPVDLIVSAIWGETVPVSKINVVGNKKVNTDFFERHFVELNGKPYSPNATNRDVEALLATGAFESVRVDTIRQEDGSVALEIEVEEAPTRQLGIYGGFATYEGPIAGFEFRNLNLNGQLRKVDAEIEASRRGLRGEISYEDPWFAWSKFRLGSSLFALNRINEGYSKFETGGRYEFTRKLGSLQRNRLSFFGQATYTDIYEVDIDRSALGDTSYFANTTGISWSFDGRDNPRKPRSGFIAQTAISVASSAIASEVEFLRATGRLGFYLPLGEATLRLSARGGMISPMGDSLSLPIDLRFYSGGAQSVRSFDERELGPRDSRGHSIGGQFYSIFNFELEIPFPCMNGLSVVPFADAGNLLEDADEAGFSDMRYGLGLGLRYDTPVGPLRVEYGYNPDRQAGDAWGAAHIGLGVAY